MKNQRGHWVFWMPTGRKNGLMWRIHTAADVNARCVSTAEGTRRGLHTQPPEPRSNFTAWTQQVCRRNVRAKEEVWQGCRSYNIFTILYTYPGITWNAKLCRSERGAGRFPLRNPESWLLLTTITWRGSEISRISYEIIGVFAIYPILLGWETLLLRNRRIPLPKAIPTQDKLG